MLKKLKETFAFSSKFYIGYSNVSIKLHIITENSYDYMQLKSCNYAVSMGSRLL